MKRFRLGTMISLLCLLSFTTSVSAECAWVLWVWAGNDWAPVKGVESSMACEIWLNQYYRDINPGREYRCLPDTVDPRAPKGSGR